MVITNLYPPHIIGGYELACMEAVKGLKSRGHQVAVLTSTYGLSNAKNDGEVYRWLQEDIGWDTYPSFKNRFELFRKTIINGKAFKRLVSIFQPDVVYVWNFTNISLGIVFIAQQMGITVCYYIFDGWLSRWENIDKAIKWWSSVPENPIKKIIKKTLGRIFKPYGLVTQIDTLDIRHAHFGSQYLKQLTLQAGKPVSHAKVIYWGVDINQFQYRRSSTSDFRRILYIGQLSPHKGVHTAIEAIELLLKKNKAKRIELTIAGGTIFPEYEEHLKNLVSTFGLERKVRFTGFILREHLPKIYQSHDILIFPSIWDEPFGITLLEAMASGLSIVATANGGSAEILKNEVNSLVFPKEDAHECANNLLKLIENQDLNEKIRLSGRQMVEDKFRIERTIDGIEQYLYEAISCSQ